MELIKTHKDLDVYRLAFDSAMEIFKMSKAFPKEETYSLTDQMRRFSKHFISKLSDCEEVDINKDTVVHGVIH